MKAGFTTNDSGQYMIDAMDGLGKALLRGPCCLSRRRVY
jgi:hypothetical protein